MTRKLRLVHPEPVAMMTFTYRLTIGKKEVTDTLEAEDDTAGVEAAQNILYFAIRDDRQDATVAVARGADPEPLQWLGAMDYTKGDGHFSWCPAEGAPPVPLFASYVDHQSFPASGPDALRRRRRIATAP